MIQSELSKARRSPFLYSFLTRFVSVWFALQIMPFPVSLIHHFSFFSRSYSYIFNALVLWTGRHIFHLTSLTIIPYNGSGDTIFNYVSLFVILVLAFVLTLAWQIIIRDQKKDKLILNWLTVYIQFFFALIMMRYGLEKVIKAQFPFPYSSLTETYGESSPMRLMWNFMGYSPAYNFILGIAEMIAGFLVLFRKTIFPGACFSIAILGNVVILNFCYDVPVKLFALSFFLMAVFIAAPDAKRLVDFFLMNKAVPAKSVIPLFKNKKAGRLFVAVKFLMAAVVFYFIFQLVWLKYTTWGDGAFKRTPLFGIYHVETFVKNTDTLPSMSSEAARWKELSIIYKKEAIIRLVNDSTCVCRLVIDTIHHRIEMAKKGDTSAMAVFSYTKPDSSLLLLNGKWKNDSLSIFLRKQDLNQYPLINRGFHWINEYPYNR